MRSLVIAALALLAAASAAQAQRVPRDDPPHNIAALRAEYEKAYDAGDADSMLRLYTDSAVRMPYDSPAQTGRGAIIAAYRATFSARQFDPVLELAADDTIVTAEWMLERGRYHETMHLRGAGGVLEENGKYVFVARHERSGGWRYAWAIFNRDAPAHRSP